MRNGFKCTIANKIKAAKKVAYFLFPCLGRQALNMQRRRRLQIQSLQLMLGKITQFEMFAVSARTGQQRQVPREGFDQTRFARAVRAEQPDAGFRRNTKLNFIENNLAAVADVSLGNM